MVLGLSCSAEIWRLELYQQVEFLASPRSSKSTCGSCWKWADPTSDSAGIRRIPLKIDRIRSGLCRIPFDWVPTRNTSEMTRWDPTVYGFRIIQDPLWSYHRKSTKITSFARKGSDIGGSDRDYKQIYLCIIIIIDAIIPLHRVSTAIRHDTLKLINERTLAFISPRSMQA